MQAAWWSGNIRRDERYAQRLEEGFRLMEWAYEDQEDGLPPELVIFEAAEPMSDTVSEDPP